MYVLKFFACQLLEKPPSIHTHAHTWPAMAFPRASAPWQFFIVDFEVSYDIAKDLYCSGLVSQLRVAICWAVAVA